MEEDMHPWLIRNDIWCLGLYFFCASACRWRRAKLSLYVQYVREKKRRTRQECAMLPRRASYSLPRSGWNFAASLCFCCVAGIDPCMPLGFCDRSSRAKHITHICFALICPCQACFHPFCKVITHICFALIFFFSFLRNYDIYICFALPGPCTTLFQA